MRLSSSLLPALARLLLSVLLLTTTFCAARTRRYTLNTTYMIEDPTKSHPRQIIAINKQFPPPVLYATVGDRVVVKLFNHLPDQPVSLHFHGLFQNGTLPSDGPAWITQCPTPPGGRMVYDFVVKQPGTYWYHSHVSGQFPDGFRGAFIVTDPNPPTKDHELYKPGGMRNSTVGPRDITLSVSDWYHIPMPLLKQVYMSPNNTRGMEPIPDAALISDAIDHQVPVQAGETYLFRLINMGAFASMYVWFEGHEMVVVEVDGVYVKPSVAEKVYITSGQRMGVLVTMKNSTDQNYPIVASMDTAMFDVVPADLNPNVTAHLVYNSTLPLPPLTPVDNFNSLDDFYLEPVDGMELLTSPDHSIVMNITMSKLSDGTTYAFFNGLTYVRAVIPSLYTVLSAPADLIMDQRIYGTYTIPFVYNHNDIIEVVLNNFDPGKHPFHLHGHNFQFVSRSPAAAGAYVSSPDRELSMPAIPGRRDTVNVNGNGNVVLRFRADNPGVWAFHCHIEWHMDVGLIATFIEAPAQIRDTITVPEDHLETCLNQGVPVVGNAAGNWVNWLDMSGENKPPAPLAKGFTTEETTTEATFALPFSTLMAILGSGVIVWYGLGEVSQQMF